MKNIVQFLLKSKKQGGIFIKATGVSMYPIIRENDLLYLKKIKFAQIQTNDILAIYKNKKQIAHRVIYIRRNYLVTRGDNNFLSDGKINNKQILGKVTHLKRNGQKILIDYYYLLQSSIYFKEIRIINRLLTVNKIDYLYLKGLPLYLKYFKTHPCRFYADCDFLIRKEDLTKITRLLIKEKYSLQESSYSTVHKLLKDKPTEYVFVKKVNNFIIRFDIHLEANFLLNQIGKLDILYPQQYIDQLSNQFLREKKIIEINKEKYVFLSDTNQILYLALHFFHHNYKGVFRLELIDKLIRLFKTFDWKMLQKRIKYYRLENYVYPVFILLKKYYKTTVNKEFLSTIKPDETADRFIKRYILKTNIFHEESNLRAGIRRFKYIFYLSPQKIYFKYLVFLYPSVIWSILWVGYRNTVTVWKRKRFYS